MDRRIKMNRRKGGWMDRRAVDGKINMCVNDLKVTAQITVLVDSWIHRTLTEI